MYIEEYTTYQESEVLALYGSVGWTAYTEQPEALRRGFAGSLLTLASRENGTLVGLLRAVGDGCTVVLVQDLLVRPDHQRRGIGTALMQAALERYLRETGVQVRHTRAAEIAVQDGAVCGVKTANGPIPADAVILATGGCSYPLTGSTGDGYRMAAALGHTIVEPVGSLVPLVERGHDCAAMQGLALKNVTLRLKNAKGKVVFEEFGELLFTHFGLSGPIVLSASAHMDRKGEAFTVDLDLKPALDEKTLDERLLRDFEKYANRDFSHALDDLLPRSMIPVVIKRSGIPGDEKVHSVTKQQRHALLNILKHFTIDIACKAPVEDAIVTSGGVKVREVDPATMESKLVRGLYFAGEVLDVDAYTGGFNLQIAWATGRAAGLAAAQTQEESE